MGSKKINKFQLITNGVMTGTAVLQAAAAQHVENFDNLGLQVDWTGAAIGVFEVLGSIDGETFHALTFDPALAQPAGSSSGYLIDINQFPWPFLQVKYTNASSTGVLNVWLFSKDLN